MNIESAAENGKSAIAEAIQVSAGIMESFTGGVINALLKIFTGLF